MLAKRLPWLREEGGFTLVLSLLVLLSLSVLSTALVVTSFTESRVSSVQLCHTQALFLAEAGVEEAIHRLNLRFPTQVTVNGVTFNAAIRDTGSLQPDWATRVFLCVYPPPGGSGNIEHTATVQPQGDWLNYSHPTNPDLALTIQHKLNGDGTVAISGDEPIHLISVSGRRGRAEREVLAEVHPDRWNPINAVLCEGYLKLSGSPTIAGAHGSVHTNGDMKIGGNADISGNATASGTITIAGNPSIGGEVIEGVPEQWIPDVKASDFRYMAEYILAADGRIHDTQGDTVSEDLGWSFSGSQWQMNENQPASGVYYIEGNASISGSPGTATTPWEATIIAEGSISFSGNSFMDSRSGGILLVAEGDANQDGFVDSDPVIELSGTADQQAANFDGAILSGGGIKVGGTPAVQGCLVAEGGLDIPLDLTGDPAITYNGTRYMLPYVRYQTYTWREK